jgi:PPP family 3-phenylpropionic acid transporter
MRAMRAQYFLTFAILGCALPYLPVLLRARGLGQTQVGYAFAIGSAAVLLAPVLVTLLADTHVDARTLMAAALVVAGAALIGLSLSHLLPLILLWYALHALAMTPVLPLQDGVLFSLGGGVAYHRVRVWGTIGFIVPSLALFWMLRAGMRIEVTLVAGAACALAGALNARLLLPRGEPKQIAAGESPTNRLPTLAALRAIVSQRHVLVFCIATFLLGIAIAPYYAFYPIYLTETVGIDPQWIGLIANVGVVIEIFFMLGFGRLARTLGMKWLVVTGFVATAARFALLAAAPNVFTAVATQVFHGMMVLMFAVVPPVFLNDHAEPRFRHSMQGLYTMLMVGVARIVGNLLSGPIAERSITALFWFAAATCAFASVLLIVAFEDRRERAKNTGEAQPLAVDA